jgi:isoleucyl-tRNA synthetase
MPFAQWHYPFENQAQFAVNFPADFISEALDQTRGWFYTLMAISTLLFDKSPYRNVIVLGLVQDRNGQKMAKHKGNVIDPWQVLDKQGADAVRWYFYTGSAPWLPSRFSEVAVSEAQRKFMGTFWNTYAFYVMYARIDQFDPAVHTFSPQTLGTLDRWILSRLNTLVQQVDEQLDQYNITASGRDIQEFTDELSNWYVRRSRERFWQSEMNQDKINAYLTLYRCLETLTRLVAPFVPFMAESIYQNLVRGQSPDALASVHLCDFPVSESQMVDKTLEKVMADVLHIVSMGRAARNLAGLKNRQPLARLLVVAPVKLPPAFNELIADELNVRQVEFLENGAGLLDYRFKPQLKTLGRRFGKRVGLVGSLLADLDGQTGMAELKQKGSLALMLEGETIELAEEDLIIETVQPKGLATEQDRDFTVAVDTHLTPELVEEGFVREIISKVQTMRKDSGFEVLDRIILRHSENSRIFGIIERNRALIAEEVLAIRIEEGSGPNSREWDLNGEKCVLSVERVPAA